MVYPCLLVIGGTGMPTPELSRFLFFLKMQKQIFVFLSSPD